MHILDKNLFFSQLKSHGYKSIGELATSLGMHRNTIHHYLSGHPVFADKLQKILDALELEPAKALVRQFPDQPMFAEPIAELVDALHAQFPEVTLILFGSRARGDAQKYSDWDIGSYRTAGLSAGIFRGMRRLKSDWEDRSSDYIDLIDLTAAEPDFLKEAAKVWRFLTGPRGDWIELNKRISQI